MPEITRDVSSYFLSASQWVSPAESELVTASNFTRKQRFGGNLKVFKPEKPAWLV